MLHHLLRFLDASRRWALRHGKIPAFRRSFYYEDRTLRMLSGGERIRVELAPSPRKSPRSFFSMSPRTTSIRILDCLEDVIRSFPGFRAVHLPRQVLIRDCANAGHPHQLEIWKKDKKPRPASYTRTMTPTFSSGDLRSRKQTQGGKGGSEGKKERDERYRRIREKVARAQNTISKTGSLPRGAPQEKMHTVKSSVSALPKPGRGHDTDTGHRGSIYFSLNGRAMPTSRSSFRSTLL